ncbi:MAG: GNAT family N-acetyltransferase [Chloroflexota bacterium]
MPDPQPPDDPIALHPPDPSIPIRAAALQDMTALLHCCWGDRSPEVAQWLLDRAARNRRIKRGTGVVVLDAQGAPIGFGQLTLWPRCAEISDLVITSDYRSLGYGTALIQHLVAQATHLGAGCVEIGAAEANTRAVDLYRRLGFVDDRTLQMHLGGPEREPVIYMKLKLA